MVNITDVKQILQFAEVSCIEPYSQVMFHLGYEFDENDVHDVKLLCETFHIEIPNEYR